MHKYSKYCDVQPLEIAVLTYRKKMKKIIIIIVNNSIFVVHSSHSEANNLPTACLYLQASIGLTTMTSLMLVVIILSDALDKSNNLPELGIYLFRKIKKPKKSKSQNLVKTILLTFS